MANGNFHKFIEIISFTLGTDVDSTFVLVEFNNCAIDDLKLFGAVILTNENLN